MRIHVNVYAYACIRICVYMRIHVCVTFMLSGVYGALHPVYSKIIPPYIPLDPDYFNHYNVLQIYMNVPFLILMCPSQTTECPALF